jgi:hypothetical protein
MLGDTMFIQQTCDKHSVPSDATEPLLQRSKPLSVSSSLQENKIVSKRKPFATHLIIIHLTLHDVPVIKLVPLGVSIMLPPAKQQTIGIIV